MLKLVDLKKEYGDGDNKIHALRGISVEFGDKGIVSVCGQSGCGKTTLLNLIGGLDRYSSGDIVIDGISTKEFSATDWDSYRNHNIGFVFQNYYLIPQLSVLENVMIAMNISGVSREEQKKKALEALKKVGLLSQIKKKPGQLSGGQAQRVAIARAICNHPEIILADEPTGALDSENSVQILEILKELSADSLVIIVTHNNELANAYSDRIIRMSDGQIISDERRTEEQKEPDENGKEKESPSFRKKKKTHISIGASFLISLKNLYYKKGRTIITAIAGCIGVIAISVILAFNAGFNAYALDFQKSQLSKYPLYVKKSQSSLSDIGDIVAKMDGSNYATLDTSTIIEILTDETSEKESYTEEQKIFIQKLITGLVANIDDLGKENDTTELSKYIKEHKAELDELCAIKYDYDLTLNVFAKETDGYAVLSPFSSRVLSGLTSQEITLFSKLIFGSTLRDKEKNDVANALGQVTFWDSLIEDEGVLSDQYDLLQGHWPTDKADEGVYEIVLVVDEYNQITDAALYALGEIGMMDLVSGILHNSGDTIEKMMARLTNGDYDSGSLAMFFEAYEDIKTEYSFSDFLYEESGKEYYLLSDTDFYILDDDGKYKNVSDDEKKVGELIETNGVSLRISGIVRQKEDVNSGCINGVIGYPQSLNKYILNHILDSDIVRKQLENYEEYISLTKSEEYGRYKDLMGSISSKTRNIETDPLTKEETMLMVKCGAYGIESVLSGQEEKLSLIEYEALMTNLGVKQMDVPDAIYFYPVSIEASEKIVRFLDDYNKEMKYLYENELSEKDNSVEYVNELKDIMSGLNGMINTITFILIAVTLLSVIVSAIMVAIIMYISVQDRTKEIGILRSMGARKVDIMNIFNSETVLLGLFSGLMGILIGYVLTYPLNEVLKQKLFIGNLLTPLWWHSLVLLGASVVLTCISGLIPAIIAAKRDPVKSLKSE